MNKNLLKIDASVYAKSAFVLSNYCCEKEGAEYDACSFKLNTLIIFSRSAKITPTKTGQFVTFWTRDYLGKTTPYNELDVFDYLVVNTATLGKLGQFVFPKEVLIQKGIIASKIAAGKRGFRVYPSWDKPTNKTAEKTQKWQLDYFYEITQNIDFLKVKKLYSI